MSKKMLINKLNQNEAVVCVVGLGYVGLPLAIEFSRSLRVIGYDINDDKIKKLNNSDSELNRGNKNLVFTNDPTKIRDADFVIITVPTPITNSKEPDLSYVEKAAKTINKNLKRDSVVILESTVYPGVTEEIVKPILEEESGMKCGVDFNIGYSPERINPGDDAHVLQNITKIVSGMDRETTDIVSRLYEKITSVYRAKNIKTAEAAKVIENIQRDLNTLFLFRKKKTCAKRKNNSFFGKAFFSKERFVIKGSKVLIMGLTYKENVPDIRETPVMGIIKELKEFGIEIFGFDPLLRREEIKAFGIRALETIGEINTDCVIITVAHDAFKDVPLSTLKGMMNNDPILIDIRGMFNREDAEQMGFCYRDL